MNEKRYATLNHHNDVRIRWIPMVSIEMRFSFCIQIYSNNNNYNLYYHCYYLKRMHFVWIYVGGFFFSSVVANHLSTHFFVCLSMTWLDLISWTRKRRQRWFKTLNINNIRRNQWTRSSGQQQFSVCNVYFCILVTIWCHIKRNKWQTFFSL